MFVRTDDMEGEGVIRNRCYCYINRHVNEDGGF